MLRRFYSTKTNFYQLFPKTFPQTKSTFQVDLKQLKKEYRSLQSQYHPDVNKDDLETSSLLNRAYNTLKEPLLRSQYLLQLNKNVNLKDEEQEVSDKSVLFDIYEIFEQLEDATEQSQVDLLKKENQVKIKETEKLLGDLYNEEKYADIINETIKLKYLKNIEQAIKSWELNKPITISH